MDELEDYKSFMEKVTPEGLFNYYSSLNRRDRKQIDKQASALKRKKHKVSLRRYNETRFKEIENEEVR